MQRRGALFSVFFIFFCVALLLFLLASNNKASGLNGFFEHLTLPLQQDLFSLVHTSDTKSEVAQVREENRKLLTQVAKQKEIEKENSALRDQFGTAEPAPEKLISAAVVGFPSFIPGESFVTQLLIDKGTDDNLKIGDVVIFKDNLIGRIAQTAPHLSVVSVITQRDNVFTAKTSKTDALGLGRGQDGGGVLLDNVVLSDKLQKGDIVITKGDVASNGQGYPPNLIVGKIVSVSKSPSALFQTAQVESLVKFSKLKIVFIIK
jgi:rod shape-determining protein MreC